MLLACSNLAGIGTDSTRALQLGRSIIEEGSSEYPPYYQWRLDIQGTVSPETFPERLAAMDVGSLERVIASAQADGYDVRYAVAAAAEWARLATDRRYGVRCPHRRVRRPLLGCRSRGGHPSRGGSWTCG